MLPNKFTQFILCILILCLSQTVNAQNPYAGLVEGTNGTFIIIDKDLPDWKKLLESALENAILSAIQPTIVNVAPQSLPQGSTADLTLTAPDSQLTLEAIEQVNITGIQINNKAIAVPNSDQLTINVTVPPDSTPNTLRDISIIANGQTITGKALFYVTPETTQPQIVSISPNKIARGETVIVTIYGQNTNFSYHSQINLGNGISTTQIIEANSNTLVAEVTSDAAATVGYHHVTVTTEATTATDDLDTIGLFYVYESEIAGLAQITQVEPFFAVQGQTLTLNLTSKDTQLLDGQTVLELSGINVLNTKVTSPTTAQAEISIPTNAALGMRHVYLKTGGETAHKFDGFVVFSPASITLDSTSAYQGEYKKLRISGENTHFKSGETEIHFDKTDITINSINVIDATTLEVIIQVADNADSTQPYYLTANTNHEIAPFKGIFTVQAKQNQINLVDLNIDVEGYGSVNIQPQDIDCQTYCSTTHDQGNTVTLQAQPANNFIGWEGNCSGADATVTLTLNSHQQCKAIFYTTPPEVKLTLEINGSGQISSLPAGINCTQSPCQANFTRDTRITINLNSTDKNISIAGDVGCGISMTLIQDMTCIVTLTDNVSNPQPTSPSDPQPTPQLPVSPIDDVASPTTTPTDSKPVVIDEPYDPSKPHLCINQREINWVCDADGESLNELQIVGSNGNVANAKLSGKIENHGRISNFTLEEGAILENTSTSSISGYISNYGTILDFNLRGGRLSGGIVGGTITGKATTESILKDVELLPNTQLSGVILEGIITGNASSPAFIENSTIYGETQLHNITLGENITLRPGVIFVQNIKFVDSKYIPDDFMHLMPTSKSSVNCAETVNYPELLDVNQHILTTHSLLEGINQIPALQSNGWTLTWHDTHHYLYLDVENTRYAVIPVLMQKTEKSTRLQIDDATSISFITANKLRVITYPALQAPCELQQLLEKSGWQFTITDNGHLRIFQSNTDWLSVQPSLISYPIDIKDENASSLVDAHFTVSHVVFKRDGQYYKQPLFPAPAFPTKLEKNVKNLTLSDGQMCFKHWGQSYCGVLDDLVTSSKEESSRFAIKTTDNVGNDLGYVVIHYQNGDEQILFKN